MTSRGPNPFHIYSIWDGSNVALVVPGRGEMMKLNNLRSVLLFTSLMVMFVSFNNCSKGFQNSNNDSTSSSPDSSDATSMTVHRSLSSTGSAGSSSANGNSDGSTAAAGVASAVKIMVSNSINGPWSENGVACRGQASFFKVIGYHAQTDALKGCAEPSAKKDCLNLNLHRVFTAQERVLDDIITSISAADSYNWPLGDYSFYISKAVDAKTIELKKVGTSNFQNCPGVGAPICEWHLLNPRFVVGPAPVAFPPSTICNPAIVGREEFGIFRVYTADPGYQSDYQYRCQCAQ